METHVWLILAAGSFGLAVITGGACHWWSARKLKAATERLHKVERAHEFSVQQTLQARKQIERLQKELAAALQRVSALTVAAMPSAAHGAVPARHAEAALAEALRAGDTAAMRPSGDGRRPLPAHGFADTEPMERTHHHA